MKWREEFNQWEVDLARYEAQSGTALPPAVRIAVVARHATTEVKEAIRQCTRIIGDDYQKLKQVALDYVVAGLSFTAAGAVSSASASAGAGYQPMEIGAIYDKGKGKKGKPANKDSGKWNGKDNGKFAQGGGKWSKDGGKPSGGKSKDQSKSKDSGKKGQSKDKGKKPYFNGACSGCGVWGHKRADCWKGTVGHVEGVEDTPSTTAVAALFATSEEPWIFAISSELAELSVAAVTVEKETLILVDSGADEHVCPRTFGDQGVDTPSTVRMQDVAGREIRNYGKRQVKFTIGQGEVASACFQVADVRKVVLSVGKLNRAGSHRVVFDTKGSYIEHLRTGKQHPLEQHGNTYYLRSSVCAVGTALDMDVDPAARGSRDPAPPAADAAVGAEAAGAAGAAAGDAAELPVTLDAFPVPEPEGLRPWSGIDAMKTRLKELGAPTYGTKEILWTRIVQFTRYARAEKALN